MAEISRKKRVNWSEAAEADMIQFWQEKMPQFRATRKNRHIYQEIADAMASVGHKYTAVEIKVKMHNFTNKYKIEKKKIGSSGISTWIHFEAVHQAIGGYKSFCSAELAEDSIVDVYVDDIYQIEPIQVESESEGESPLPSPRASSVTSNRPSSSEADKTVVSVMDEMRKDFVKVFQAINDAEEKRLRILEKVVKDVSEMKDAFIEFLRRQN
ncbi:myb/SANT-like DNA-binding domain-containing protein 1 [Zeugodacus cucurbitae]|uniref:myb/SANT-like DNA-binding domain-containing protein 1 n=1 Tax=Zeugodacus cucurbitae TaxID=28588 RepID=UPI000596862C|nr:myb/SANT-like DNA-binding domain-containing protein 1 [Zeugodacus cucurbitae]